MLIEEEKLRHWIDHFYGYGSWEARFWFVPYEDGGGELPEEVAEKINYFFEAHPPGSEAKLCDIRELYKYVIYRSDGPKAELYATRFEYRFGPKAKADGIWKNLIAFVHGYRDKKQPNILSYQKNKLALPSRKSEAFIPFYPLPSPHSHAWYYSWLHAPQLPFIKTRAGYESHVFQQRANTFLSNINTYQPELVLMYGMNNINALKKTVQEFFPDVKFKAVKGVKLQTPQHHRADCGKTKLIITTQIPALRHNRVETGFDWEKFGRDLR